jgi:hypothetical protein
MLTLIMGHTKAVQNELIETSVTLGGNRWQVLWTVIVPGVMPNVATAMRHMLAISWTYFVIAEIVRCDRRHRRHDDQGQALHPYRQDHGRHPGTDFRLYAPLPAPGAVQIPGRERKLGAVESEGLRYQPHRLYRAVPH